MLLSTFFLTTASAQEYVHTHTLTRHTGTVWSIAFKDNSTLISGSQDHTLRAWNVDTGEQRWGKDVGDAVYAVAIPSHDPSFVAYGGAGDLGIRMRYTDDGTWRGSVGSDWVFDLAFKPNSYILAGGHSFGTVLLWDIAPVLSITADVNGDGVVNVIDLALVALRLGQTGSLDVDVNGDSVVDIDDLIQVAGSIGNTGQAPQAQPLALTTITPADVHSWIAQAQALNRTDAITKRGIRFLEQLLSALTPKTTILLANYPNPFNPETWIPYHLANDSDVLLSLYDINGGLIRQLDLGYQSAGYYTDKMRAAYWDGRNDLGEPVSSGIYFYQLRAVALDSRCLTGGIIHTRGELIKCHSKANLCNFRKNYYWFLWFWAIRYSTE